MEALSALSSISSSNALASLTAPAVVTPSQPAAIPEPSVTTFFSDLALTLLEQQANDPSQSIEDALAASLLNSAVGTSGQPLYTASGVLQQFAASVLLSQNQAGRVDGAGNDQVNGAAVNAVANSAVPPTAAAATPASNNANQALTDLINSFRQPAPVTAFAQQTALPSSRVGADDALTSAGQVAGVNASPTGAALNQQISLINQLPALTTQEAFSSRLTATAALNPIVIPPDFGASTVNQAPFGFDAAREAAAALTASRQAAEDAVVAADVDAALTNDVITGTVAPLGTDEVTQPIDEQTVLNAQSLPTEAVEPGTEPVVVQPDFASFNNDDQVPFGFDEYQQAALASGFTAFGKELSSFVPASGETITQAAIGQVDAITPVMRIGARADETTEA